MSESMDKIILLLDYTLCNVLEFQLKLFYTLFSYDILADTIYLFMTFSDTATWAKMSILILKTQRVFSNSALLELCN